MIYDPFGEVEKGYDLIVGLLSPYQDRHNQTQGESFPIDSYQQWGVREEAK